MGRERQSPEKEFWTVDEQLGTVSLFGADAAARMRAHVSEETYTPYVTRGELIPLQAAQGVRDYVLIHPYILVPDITLEASFYPRAKAPEPIGHVIASAWQGMRHERIGQGQAWHYREDRTILLWELLLYPRYRDEDAAPDANLHALWQAFERFLANRFPTAQTIATPAQEPEYEQDQWRDFLIQLGYREQSEQILVKEVVRR